jgi:hypothetical protein
VQLKTPITLATRTARRILPVPNLVSGEVKPYRLDQALTSSGVPADFRERTTLLGPVSAMQRLQPRAIDDHRDGSNGAGNRNKTATLVGKPFLNEPVGRESNLY